MKYEMFVIGVHHQYFMQDSLCDAYIIPTNLELNKLIKFHSIRTKTEHIFWFKFCVTLYTATAVTYTGGFQLVC